MIDLKALMIYLKALMIYLKALMIYLKTITHRYIRYLQTKKQLRTMAAFLFALLIKILRLRAEVSNNLVKVWSKNSANILCRQINKQDSKHDPCRNMDTFTNFIRQRATNYSLYVVKKNLAT